jgi:hypothetical protein
MFSSFPNLAKAIVAERAADLQRDAAQYRSAHDRRAQDGRARRLGPWSASPARRVRRALPTRRPQQPASPVAGTASRESCATSRAI